MLLHLHMSHVIRLDVDLCHVHVHVHVAYVHVHVHVASTALKTYIYMNSVVKWVCCQVTNCEDLGKRHYLYLNAIRKCRHTLHSHENQMNTNADSRTPFLMQCICYTDRSIHCYVDRSTYM